MNNAVGVADVPRMLAAGVLVGLGTDAMTTNMLEEVRAALWVRHLAAGNPSVGFVETLSTLLVNNPTIAGRYWPGLGLGRKEERPWLHRQGRRPRPGRGTVFTLALADRDRGDQGG